MRTTFLTRMPDKAGAFLKASKIIASAGGNIVRVSYNKAVDSRLLSIDVKCDEHAKEVITEELKKIGYLLQEYDAGVVMLTEFKLRDVPGSVTPILEIINEYNFNISYISSTENGTPYQFFRMGLFVERASDVKSFLDRVSALCEVRIIEYDSTEKALDNTVFYLSFANGIAEKLHLDDEARYTLISESNKIMQMLEDKGEQPHKTFEYIAAFADRIARHGGEGYRPETELKERNGTKIYCIQPPCGSNTFLVVKGEEVLIVDGGYTRLKGELLSVCEKLVSGFSDKKITHAITHPDIDHVGLCGIYKTFMSASSAENFFLERSGEPDYRESNRFNAPYCRIGKVLSGYVMPPEENVVAVGSYRRGSEPLSYIGEFDFASLKVKMYEGTGGHVRGETVYVIEDLKIVFSGDIYINAEGLSADQREFNSLAPYLMSGVNVDSREAAVSRNALKEKYCRDGWIVCCGHGSFAEF